MFNCYTQMCISILQIIDLSGNNSFYFTTNLVTGNYSLMTVTGGQGSNILEKIQLKSDGTGFEFFKYLYIRSI